MSIRTNLSAFVTILGIASTLLAQGGVAGRTPSDPPKLETARFGNPTSTARAYQNYKFGIVKEIKKDELILDKTPYGDAHPFKLLEKTKFLHDGTAAKIDNLKVGDHVFVHVKTNKRTGEFMVDVVAWGVVGKKMKGQGVKR